METFQFEKDGMLFGYTDKGLPDPPQYIHSKKGT